MNPTGKKRMKKAQITIFMIIGIILLVVFGFMFYVTSITAERELEESVSQTTGDLTETTAIKYYVTTCLDNALVEATKLIGLQGGVFYPGQPGSLIDPTDPVFSEFNYVEYKGSRIPYYITKPKDSGGEEQGQQVERPPFYPCYSSNVKIPDIFKGPKCYESYSHTDEIYTLGNSMYPPLYLCKEEYVVEQMGGAWCNCPLKYCDFSIQEQLEVYIANYTKNCANITPEKFPGFEVRAGDVKARVLPSDEDLSVIIDFPIEIRIEGYKPVTEVMQFFSYQPVRINKIYRAVFGLQTATDTLIYKDTHNSTFDITRDSYEIFRDIGLSGVTIQRIPHPEYLDVSIIIINDTSKEHLLAGENFIFRFARENRNPALNYISSEPCSGDSDGDGVFESYDFCILEGDAVIIEPLGFDPDNPGKEEVVYRYHGWKTPSEGPSMIADMEPGLKNLWEDSDLYKRPGEGKCVNIVTGLTETERCASYTTNKVNDQGPHNITVEIADPEGLTSTYKHLGRDWQDITIVVNDKPEPEIVTGMGGCPRFADGMPGNRNGYFDFVARQDHSGSIEYMFEGSCGDEYFPIYDFDWFEVTTGGADKNIGETSVPPREDTNQECKHTYSTNYFRLGAGDSKRTYNVRLAVTDSQGITGYSEVKPLTVYPDIDGDGWCDFQDQASNPLYSASHDADDNLDGCGANCNPGISGEASVLNGCSDGLDNDQDGKIDCEDFTDCMGLPGTIGGMGECCEDWETKLGCNKQNAQLDTICVQCQPSILPSGVQYGFQCVYPGTTQDCGKCLDCDGEGKCLPLSGSYPDDTPLGDCAFCLGGLNPDTDDYCGD